MATTSPIRDEEAAAIFGSPSFTPRGRDKPLPPISQADVRPSSTFIQSPTSWYIPNMDSPLRETSLLDLFPNPGPRIEETYVLRRRKRDEESREEWQTRQNRIDSFSGSSESPISQSSSSQLDSIRFSCSTMSSSATRACSESSITTSPQAYGFALGSPKVEGGERMAQKAQISPVGSGLSDDQHVPKKTGPYSHHRTPSWTLQNHSLNLKAILPTTTAPIPESPYDSNNEFYDSNNIGTTSRLPIEITVPTRFASRSRTSSIASSKNQPNIATDEMPALSRSNTAQSMSTNSIESSTPDSVFSQPSPRSSSLRKSKSRPKLKTKASEPIFTAQKAPFQPAVSRAKAGSVGEAHAKINGWTVDRAANASPSTMCDLDDYLVYTGEGAYDVSSPLPLALTVAEKGQGVFVVANEKTLNQLELEARPDTTHLLLSGCQKDGLFDFLERTLPIVAANLLVLDVSNTSLSLLPESLAHCAKLEELNISSNCFSQPWNGNVLSDLFHLRVLLADSCQFSLLPRETGQLQNLKTLSLRRNNLSHLPSWLHRLNKLEQLFLEGNPFQGAWQQVCAAFLSASSEPQSAISSSRNPRPMMERAPASAPSKLMQSGEISLTASTQELSYEELEEMIDGVSPTSAPLNTNKAKEEKLMKPLMRRMMSATVDAGREEDGSLLLSRRPSQTEMGENKWGSLMKKLSRKASNSQISVSSIFLDSARSSESNSPVQSRSNSISHQKVKINTPLTPVGWQDEDSSDSSWAKIANISKRTSFLPISQVYNRRKIGALLQYLKDLEDLKAIRVGPPGTLLPMETSMAPRYSSPTKGVNTMDRSGSETSRESMHSNSSSSAQSAMEQQFDGTTLQSTKDDAQRRIHILQEIVATEVTYVRGLHELVEIYVVPSGIVDSSTGQQAISAVERRNVFGNIEGIFHFHQFAFLPALRTVTQALISNLEEVNKDSEAFNTLSASLTEQMANVFNKHAAYFRMYSAYVNNVDSAQKRVAQWKLPKTSEMNQAAFDGSILPSLNPKERKRIRSFIKKTRSDSRHSQLSLETYLHLPVQRIPRYRLLFEDLVRSCPSHRLSDPTSITRALDSICSVATLMNESKRQSENDRKLLEWQARIRGRFASPLLQPHRRLIMDGTLILRRVVMRTTAFHMAKSQWSQLELETSIKNDGSVTNTELGIVQIDCLDQQSMEQSVKLLLCNDITVVVTQDSTQQGLTSPVDLFAVLRIQSPVQIVGQTTLRLVDPKHILYLSASTPREAQTWKTAIMSVHQEQPKTPAT